MASLKSSFVYFNKTEEDKDEKVERIYEEQLGMKSLNMYNGNLEELKVD